MLPFYLDSYAVRACIAIAISQFCTAAHPSDLFPDRQEVKNRAVNLEIDNVLARFTWEQACAVVSWFLVWFTESGNYERLLFTIYRQRKPDHPIAVGNFRGTGD